MNKRLKFYQDVLEVEQVISDSSQATVFLGREKTLGIRVVLKQYLDDQFKGILRELKIFTELEKKDCKKQNDNLAQIIEHGPKHNALPHMLSYTVQDETVGEILMTYGGPTLKYWMRRISTKQKRIDFIMTMLPQVIQGLRLLHRFGYSHGDLKGENICARIDSNGNFKFTLIDLGICTKLPRMGSNPYVPNFKGNLMFSSANQIKNNRPNEIDDVYSLICVAYKFIIGSLPWMEFMRKFKEQSGFDF